MAEKLVKWGTVLLFLAVGISFFTTIRVKWLPVLVHQVIGAFFLQVIGAFFLLVGGYIGYQELK